jgi:hypothetical protein
MPKREQRRGRGRGRHTIPLRVRTRGAKLLKFDEIGYWSEVKLEIVKKYAAAYSKIMTAQTAPPLHHVYIDGFSGSGIHLSRTAGEFIAGSPLNALSRLLKKWLCAVLCG